MRLLLWAVHERKIFHKVKGEHTNNQFSNRSMSRIWGYNFCNANPCNYYLTLKTSISTQSAINQRLHNAVDAPRKTSQWPNSVHLEVPNSSCRFTTKVSGLLLHKLHSLSPDKLKHCSKNTRERYMVTIYVFVKMQNLNQREMESQRHGHYAWQLQS